MPHYRHITALTCKYICKRIYRFIEMAKANQMDAFEMQTTRKSIYGNFGGQGAPYINLQIILSSWNS